MHIKDTPPPEKLKLFLNDVALKSGGVKPEIWQPAPIDKEPAGGYKSLPFYIEWKYDPIPNVDINLSPFVEALTTLPVIPVYGNTAYMSVSEALSLVLRTVAFRPTAISSLHMSPQLSELSKSHRLNPTVSNTPLTLRRR